MPESVAIEIIDFSIFFAHSPGALTLTLSLSTTS